MVCALSTGLKARGTQISAAAMVPLGGPGNQWVEEIRDLGIEVDVLPPTFALHRDLSAMRAVLVKRQADVLHAHGYRADILGSLLSRNRPASVATLHGFSPTNWKDRWYTRFDRLALRRFDRVAVVSAPLRAILLESGISPKAISVVHNGIDVKPAAASASELRARLGLDPQTLVVGSVGRLSREKGHQVLLHAVAQARPQLPDIQVVLVGDGPERSTLERLAFALGIAQHVLFLGQRRDLERLYPAFDLFVLPSLSEGSPTALLEASAYGIPTLATRVGAIPDMFDDGTEVALVPAGNVLQLTHGLMKLGADPVLRTLMARSAKLRYETEYRAEHWLERMEAIYAEARSARPA